MLSNSSRIAVLSAVRITLNRSPVKFNIASRVLYNPQTNKFNELQLVKGKHCMLYSKSRNTTLIFPSTTFNIKTSYRNYDIRSLAMTNSNPTNQKRQNATKQCRRVLFYKYSQCCERLHLVSVVTAERTVHRCARYARSDTTAYCMRTVDKGPSHTFVSMLLDR